VRENGRTQKDVLVLFKEPTEDSHEHRCLCGSLLAKITPQGIELKCRKCKRLQIIPRSRIIRTLTQET
jgi:phage FluMu protein Com